jgi:hypothetical protein
MEDRVQRVNKIKDAICDALSSTVEDLIDQGHNPDEVYDACCHAVHDLVGNWLLKSIKKDID